MHDLRVVFMGTPEFSVPSLEYLINNCNVVLVVTQPDKKIGRNKELSFSPIKKLAIEHNIEVFQPIKIRNDYNRIKEVNPDIIITCAFGQILPKEVLDIPYLGSFNLHASLLPKYRGATPMQAAILNGDSETGVTLMYMDENMDTGDIVSSISIRIDNEDNIGTIHDKLSLLGSKLLEKELPKIMNNTNKRQKQDDSKATYTKILKREDELLDFNNTGNNIINKIRAFDPYPLVYFTYHNNEIKVVKAHFVNKDVNTIGKIIYEKKAMGITCKDGIIYLDRIKPFGKKEMDIMSYLNGITKGEDDYVI